VTWGNRSRAIFCLPILLAAACHRDRVAGDELVYLMEDPAASIDPRFIVGAYDFKISHLVYEPLVAVDTPDLTPRMALAESVVPSGNDWIVSLREARFSDGKPVTTADVAWTIAQLRDPATGGAAARYRRSFEMAGLTAVEVVSPKQIILRLAHPFATLVTDLDFGIMEKPSSTQARSSAGSLPRGAGPFFLERREGESWHLAANPYFYGGRPRLSRVTFKLIPDDNSRLLALVGGSGDLTQNTVSPLLLDAVAAQPKIALVTGHSSVYSYLGLNCDDPILKDVRVRRAIAYAIDRERILHTKLRDRAVLATGMLPTFHWAYEKNVDTYSYDPGRARRLLDEAGLRSVGGRPRFHLVFKTSSNKFRVAMARVIASMLADVGIEVELRPYEWGTFFADVKKGNFQMFMMQIPEIAEPDLYTTFFASDRIPTRDDLDAGNNRVRYRNPELDRLLDAGRLELDRGKRKRIYATVQRILARDVPVISLWHDDNVAVMRKNVRGFQVLPTAMLTSLARAYKTGDTHHP
jgi:peptide/nickel transport system substrate-binding protein